MKYEKLPLNFKGHLWSATFEAFDFSTKVLRGLAGRHMKTKYLKLMLSKKALKTITYFSSERSNFLIPNDSKDYITFRSINKVSNFSKVKIIWGTDFRNCLVRNFLELEFTKLIKEKIYLHPSHRYKKTE